MLTQSSYWVGQELRREYTEIINLQARSVNRLCLKVVIEVTTQKKRQVRKGNLIVTSWKGEWSLLVWLAH